MAYDPDRLEHIGRIVKRYVVLSGEPEKRGAGRGHFLEGYVNHVVHVLLGFSLKEYTQV